jgi:hypothetical protein
MPPGIDLPTKKELNDRKLAVTGPIRAPSRSKSVSELSPEERDELRLYDLSRQRKKRKT